MRQVLWRPSTLRVAALLSVGALGVHQLRYLLAFGDASGRQLGHDGHGYLSGVAPACAVLLALAFGHVIFRATRPTVATPHHRVSRRRFVVLLTLVLLAIYCGQELLEGQLGPHHANGIAGVLGNGGWLAVPLAAVIGWMISLTIRLAEHVLAGRESRVRPLRPWTTDLVSHSGRPARRPRATPLASHLAGRAPPVVSV